MSAQMDTLELDRLIRERLDALLPQKLAELKAAKTPSMVIIATKGTLDWAYPPFILSSTAAALGWDVSVFFTFYGLNLLRKDISDLKISPLGNPGMPMKMPFGPEWFKGINWNIPNAVQETTPAVTTIASGPRDEAGGSKSSSSQLIAKPYAETTIPFAMYGSARPANRASRFAGVASSGESVPKNRSFAIAMIEP